ncbi:MAG TPA: YbaK/EbsC family protein [Pirellulales bacterium]|jgi:Ala-tRNA(Pro) deacylase|nr:YbaK/EbsC family protein [Pirellulales bacterium]
MNVRRFLHQRGIAHQMLAHEPTFSAQRMAEMVHVSGDEVAKAVLLKIDGKYELAVLPATYYVYPELVRQSLQARAVELATEEECGRIFPDCEVGALPPFGSLYGLQTVIDASLTEDDEIVFEGNTHHEAIRMKFQDFERIERPQIATIACHHLA